LRLKIAPGGSILGYLSSLETVLYQYELLEWCSGIQERSGTLFWHVLAQFKHRLLFNTGLKTLLFIFMYSELIMPLPP